MPGEDGGEEAVLLAEPAGGKDYGTWWHDALARFPWAGDDAAQAQVIAEALTRAAVEWRERAERELNRFLASAERADLSAAAREGATLLTEVPFTVSSTPRRDAPAMLAEGIMDLVVLPSNGGPIWIFDWKTDRPATGEDAGELLQRLRTTYAPQLEEYACAFAPDPTRLTLFASPLGRGVEWAREGFVTDRTRSESRLCWPAT